MEDDDVREKLYSGEHSDGDHSLQLLCCLPFSSARAHAQEATVPTLTPATFGPPEPVDKEYEKDIASLQAMGIRKSFRIKIPLLERLRHIDREWPRLMLDYVNPLVRNMVSTDYRDNLSLATTLFNDRNRGLALRALVARDIRGDREARLSFAMRF